MPDIEPTQVNFIALPKQGTLLCQYEVKGYEFRAVYAHHWSFQRDVSLFVKRLYGGHSFEWSTRMEVDVWNQHVANHAQLYEVVADMVHSLQERFPELKVV